MITEAPREDPVIHFYELFLKEYDAEKRMQRGVFYTPRPIVSYIVRSVHTLLQSEFGLKDGLADTATWGEMAERREGLSIPDAISPDQGFVQILDPATGTGTFLVEAIDFIHKTLVAKWQAHGHGEDKIDAFWNEYVPKHLLPRLHGYELLMAPYAIAHLKIGLKLYETGYRFGSDERARVYLTNALESEQDFSQGAFDFAIPALADEAQAVNEVKRAARFTVIIGNPPYSGHSANNGAWIRELLRGSAGTLRVENYFEVDSGPLNERNPKWLNDDYVKFIRLAHWQIERTGLGLLGFITNHSYLDNPTFRGMRESLTATFPRAHLLDLHGNAKKKERAPDGGKDENVFDIQQGVAVGLFTCFPSGTEPICPAYNHADVWGVREQTGGAGKYDRLVASDVANTEWQALSLKAPLHLFVPRDETLNDEYRAGWKLTNVFLVHSVGIVTARDKLAIRWTADEMSRVAKDFSERDSEEGAVVLTDWGRTLVIGEFSWRRKMCGAPTGVWFPFSTGPLTKGLPTTLEGPAVSFVCLARKSCDICWRGRISQGMWALVTARSNKSSNPDHFFCSRFIVETKCGESTTQSCTIPLYLYPATDGEALSHWPASSRGRWPNFNPEFIADLEKRIKLPFISDGNGDLKKTFGPEDVFHYIYAVLHSPEYRRRYADFLKLDFPRIPLPGNRAFLADLVRLGVRLVSLHLMDADGIDARAAFPDTGSNQVDKVRYAPPTGGLPGRVWINREQYFESVEPEVWAFTIGGYRPAEKWLKDRKGRALSEDDIDHYLKIIAALAETRRLMVKTRRGHWKARRLAGGVPDRRGADPSDDE